MVEYISKININNKDIEFGGYNFDDKWIYKYYNILGSAFQIATGDTKTFDLSSYLPNDGYDYEVKFDAMARTGTTNGNQVDIRLYSGSSTSGSYMSARMGRVVTRTASDRQTGGCCILVIKSSDKKNIVIGGNNFDGKWINSYKAILNNVSLNENDTTIVSLDSYLPNDGYDYEVIINARGNTLNSSGSANLLDVGRPDSSFYSLILRQNTRATNYQQDRGTTIIPVSASDRSIKFRCREGSISSLSANIQGYRRIGKNDSTSNKYISNINIDNKNIVIGGNNFDGKWIVSKYYLANAITYASGVQATYSLSSYLPNDGYDYEVKFEGWSRTGSATGNYTFLTLYNSSSTSNRIGVYLGGNFTRTNSSEINSFNATLPIMSNNRNVSIEHTGNSTSGSCGLMAVAYRRIGTNT